MWLTISVRFRRASSSSLEMHSTLSLLTCSSESEKDDYEERFERIQTPEDHDMHQPSLEEDQGDTLMLFTNTVYVNAVIWNDVIDFCSVTGASDDPNDWDSSKVSVFQTRICFCFADLKLDFFNVTVCFHFYAF